MYSFCPLLLGFSQTGSLQGQIVLSVETVLCSLKKRKRILSVWISFLQKLKRAKEPWMNLRDQGRNICFLFFCSFCTEVQGDTRTGHQVPFEAYPFPCTHPYPNTHKGQPQHRELHALFNFNDVRILERKKL